MNFFDAKVTEIRREIGDAYSFVMEIPEGFQWKAGQHVLWKLKGYTVEEGDRDTRVFTIASAPEDGFLMFTTRITELHTSFKEVLLHQLKVGDVMQVAVPRGSFDMDTENFSSTMIVAGGIGVTTIRSILRSYMEHPKEGHPVTVLYSERDGNFSYQELWEEIRTRVPGLEINLLTDSDEVGNRVDAYAKEHGQNAEFLIAGPPRMNEAYTERLNGLGVPEGNIKTDVFMGYDD